MQWDDARGCGGEFRRSDDVDFNNPIHSFAGAELDPSLTWRDIAWLRDVTSLPIIAKGLMNPRDIAPALERRARLSTIDFAIVASASEITMSWD